MARIHVPSDHAAPANLVHTLALSTKPRLWLRKMRIHTPNAWNGTEGISLCQSVWRPTSFGIFCVWYVWGMLVWIKEMERSLFVFCLKVHNFTLDLIFLVSFDKIFNYAHTCTHICQHIHTHQTYSVLLINHIYCRIARSTFEELKP